MKGNQICISLLTGFVLTVSLNSFAQSPLPGNADTSNQPLPAPSTDTVNYSAPVPGNGQASQVLTNALPSNQSITNSTLSPEAPISLKALQESVENLKNSNASEESLNQQLVWLDTLIKAHNKLANTFAKQNNTSAACDSERNLSKQIYQIKDQVLYLKAQLLIKANRIPEAMNILVSIVTVEPQSALGQQAYQSLKKMGFSPALPTNTNKPNKNNKVRVSRHSTPKPASKSAAGKITPHHGF